VQDHSLLSGEPVADVPQCVFRPFHATRRSIGHPAGPRARTNHALSHVDKLAASMFVNSGRTLAAAGNSDRDLGHGPLSEIAVI
jgi:hypothetical protein